MDAIPQNERELVIGFFESISRAMKVLANFGPDIDLIHEMSVMKTLERKLGYLRLELESQSENAIFSAEYAADVTGEINRMVAQLQDPYLKVLPQLKLTSYGGILLDPIELTLAIVRDIGNWHIEHKSRCSVEFHDGTETEESLIDLANWIESHRFPVTTEQIKKLLNVLKHGRQCMLNAVNSTIEAKHVVGARSDVGPEKKKRAKNGLPLLGKPLNEHQIKCLRLFIEYDKKRDGTLKEYADRIRCPKSRIETGQRLLNLGHCLPVQNP